MKSFKLQIVLLLLAVCGTFSVLVAADAKVATANPGDQAPELKIDSYVCGEKLSIASCRDKAALTLLFWQPSPAGAAALRHFETAAQKCKDKKLRFMALAAAPKEQQNKLFSAKKPSFTAAVASESEMFKFLRPGDRLPAAAIVGADGKLLWRGPAAAVVRFSTEAAAGELDAKEVLRKENLAVEIGKAVRASDFSRAVKLIDGELKKNPKSAELASYKAALLAQKLNRPDEAVATVETALAASPKNAALYDLGARLLHALKRENQLSDLYRRMTGELGDNPALMMKFADFEMAQPVEEMRPDCIVNLTSAAVKSTNFSDAREHGAVLLGHSRALYLCGRADLALTAVKQAIPLLKNDPKMLNSAKRLAGFYNRIISISKQLDGK